MADLDHTLEAGLAARLPAEVRRLLETRVPRSPDYQFNYGILSGLTFALRLLKAAPCTPEQEREALAEAIAVTKSRIAQQEEAMLPELYARAKKEFTADQLAEYANMDEKDMIPSDQFLRELEQILREEDSSNGEVR
jgi:hypothetical protein